MEQIMLDRRALHRIPELDRALPKTVAYVRRSLDGLGCTLTEPAEGALCAFFDFGRQDSIAFRADMDALPISENTGLAFSSDHPGKMHACGHDGHTAILLELARRLAGKKNLPHNVLLVFQPAEETTGGAKAICLSGIFAQRQVRAIFGLHLWPGLEAGVIASRRGELMCRSREVRVEVTGKSAHVAKAGEGRDALLAAMAFFRWAMELEADIPAVHRRLFKFCHMESGRVCNAISDHTLLEGTLRAFQPQVMEELCQGLENIGLMVQRQYGVTVRIRMTEGYPALINPEGLYDEVRKKLPFRELEEPSMTAEDFSWYQQYLPGLFFFLGVGDTPALHADTFDFDEEILSKGADFFEKLAELDL